SNREDRSQGGRSHRFGGGNHRQSEPERSGMSATTLIHPTAIIEKGVELDGGVKIGPYAVLKGKVQVGTGTVIESHVVVGSDHGSVKLGKNNHLFSGAMVGGP